MPTRKPLQTAAAAFSSVTLLAQPAFAADACCKDSCCDDKKDAAFAALTGDWGGVRSTLKQNGVELSANYTAELFGNPKGGKKRSIVFDGLLKLTLDVNLDKTVGWHDASFRMSGLYPHGTSGTLRNVGDASIFSNIDSYDTVRLIDFWIEQRLIDDKASIKIGQMRVDDEFGVTDTAAFFVNSTFGTPNPAKTPMPLATYPVAALGIRLKMEPVKGLYGQVGIYDGNPSSGDFADPSDGATGSAKRHGTDWALRSSEGTLYAGEVGFQRSEGAFPGAYRLGLLRHTDDFADVREGVNATHSGSTSGYYVIDQTLWQKAEGSKEGVSAFLRGTMADEKTSNMSDTVQVGAVYTGLLSTEDKLGLAFARNKFSPGQEDQPSRETIVELTYQVPLKPYLRVQPDLQYISRPGGTSEFNNAWVVGVRATLDF